MSVCAKPEKSLVMVNLGPAIHDLRAVGRAARRSPACGIEDAPDLKRRESGPGEGVDGRVEPGHDGCERAAPARPVRAPIRAFLKKVLDNLFLAWFVVPVPSTRGARS